MDKLAFLLPLLLFSNLILCAQERNVRQRKVRIIPLPVILYSPETRLGLGALIAAGFKTNQDSVTRVSFARSSLIFTTNKQYMWGNIARIYSPSNQYIFQGSSILSFFPEYYYGIETEQPKAKEVIVEYKRTLIDVRVYKRVINSFYVGFSTRYNNIYNVTSDSSGSLYLDKPTGYNGYHILGLSPIISLETRDNQVYPRKGIFLEIQLMTYPKWLNSSFEFFNARFDVRKYVPLSWFSNRDVLAVQMVINLNTGQVPFKDMADIGDGIRMRGYYMSYYRYNNLYAFQAEYRAGLWKSIGCSVWLGGAFTPRQWYSIGDSSFKPNAGVGLRFMINKNDKLNIRADYGFGKQGQRGFYLDIAEAF